ncbi:MAG: cyclic nucleotide-binding domain-containing protein [Candidatus Hydrogenedens sp.]|nr:cyclic nucleotide-binding domain-containing protein [Candidatus Hydrogenedens sp.]
MDSEKVEKYRRYAEKVRIFQNLDPQDVSTILHHGKVLNFREGQTIFHEGMLGSNLFIVLKGEVAIQHKNELIAKCKVGDAFGEMAVLNHEPRTATALALTECRCFTLEEREVNELLEQKLAVRVLLNVIHVLSERLEGANAYITEMKKNHRQLG